MKRLGSLVILVTIALLLVACSAGTDPIDQEAESIGTTGPPSAPEPTVEEQARIVTGREGVVLVPMQDAQAWLGNEDLTAYSDPSTHDEFIVNTARGQLLAYVPGTVIYQEPLDLPMYEGEPSREEVLAMADAWAHEHTPQYDISTMRRTAWRRVAGHDTQGDLLDYQVEYRSYVDGVRVPGYVSVTVTLPSWVWEPSFSGFESSEPYGELGAPEATMLEALESAATEAGMADYAVKRAELAMQGGGLRWMIELEDEDVDPAHVGGGTAWMQVDAITGEVVATAY